jgi:hypothetical protein
MKNPDNLRFGGNQRGRGFNPLPIGSIKALCLLEEILVCCITSTASIDAVFCLMIPCRYFDKRKNLYSISRILAASNRITLVILRTELKSSPYNLER